MLEESGERNVIMELEEQWICEWEECGKVCKSKAGLTVHRRRMHERSDQKVTFKCQGCTLQFSFDSNLKNHQKSCTGVITVDPDLRKCGNCGKSFSRSNIARHRRTCGEIPAPAAARVGEKKTCNTCGTRISKANLARHKTLMHGE